MQNIKLRVEGGKIVVAANTLANLEPKKKTNRFPMLFSFKGIDEIQPENYVKNTANIID